MEASWSSEDGRTFVEVTGLPLGLAWYADRVGDPGAGAISTFSGVTRNNFSGKAVLRLEYEAYAPMAVKKLRVRAGEGRRTPSGGTGGGAACRTGRFACMHTPCASAHAPKRRVSSGAVRAAAGQVGRCPGGRRAPDRRGARGRAQRDYFGLVGAQESVPGGGCMVRGAS
jgi:hypothetical protein